jgi:glycosyltransferase involved in cell wall biosynthesis
MVQVPPPVHGAALRNKSLVDSQLLNRRFDIRLLALSFVTSIHEIGSVTPGKLIKAIKYAGQLVRQLLLFRPDLAYFTLTPEGGAFYRDVVFVVTLKLFRLPIIYHLRGIGIQRAMNRSVMHRMLYRFVFNNVYVVCLSPSHLADVAGLNYRKHFVVPNGIAVEKTLSRNAGSSREILFLSNYVRSKGVFEFIDAIKILSSKRSDFTARMVGADADVKRSEIKEYAHRAGIEHLMQVDGPLFEKAKFDAIAGSFCFVFPTYYPFELFPGVILEAMQCGRPVISTDHGVIRDILDHNQTGIVVPPRSVADLVKEITNLLDHPDVAEELGRRAREKFLAQYTLNKFESNIEYVFDQINKA